MHNDTYAGIGRTNQRQVVCGDQIDIAVLNLVETLQQPDGHV